MKCPLCDNGEVYRGSSIPDDDGWETCMCCNGTGEMPTAEKIAELRGKYMAAVGDLQATEYELQQYKEHAKDNQANAGDGYRRA